MKCIGPFWENKGAGGLTCYNPLCHWILASGQQRDIGLFNDAILDAILSWDVGEFATR